MASDATIIDMTRNGFLDRPTTKNKMSDDNTSIFSDFTGEFQITAIICAVQ